MKNISELIKENSEIISERQARSRQVNLFVMKCGATNTILNKVQEYADLLKAKTIYAFDTNKVEKVKKLEKYEWNGPHFDDSSVASKYIIDNCIGNDNFIFIP